MNGTEPELPCRRFSDSPKSNGTMISLVETGEGGDGAGGGAAVVVPGGAAVVVSYHWY